MSQVRRTSSRNSLGREQERNKSNSNTASIQSGSSDKIRQTKQVSSMQKESSVLKILGQDAEVSIDELMKQDRYTPNSSRSMVGSRPGSTNSRRTPTPSKQISLQSVKRKEEKDEPIEEIDWNDFNKPVDMTEKKVREPASDEESDISRQDSALSAAEHLALVEQRERDLASALSTHRPDPSEAELARKLDLIELRREEMEQHERKEEEKLLRHLENERVSAREDGSYTYRNDHFRDLSNRDRKNKLDTDFIMGNYKMDTENDSARTVKVEKGVEYFKFDSGESHAIDKEEETMVRTAFQQESKENTSSEIKISDVKEREKKDEASADTPSSDDSDDDEEEEDDDDLIGRKGKAPNALLMEFVTCMMEEDYENAEKLCKMILIYEPDNPEALSFYPLIQEKRKQEEEDDEEESDSDEESDDSGEEEDSDDDDDDEDDDDEENSSSEESDTDQGPNHPDSGIASANSD